MHAYPTVLAATIAGTAERRNPAETPDYVDVARKAQKTAGAHARASAARTSVFDACRGATGNNRQTGDRRPVGYDAALLGVLGRALRAHHSCVSRNSAASSTDVQTRVRGDALDEHAQCCAR
jgi:hypothetical protein